jgi:hypothetical protein
LATTSRAKFEKYFKNHDVSTHIKSRRGNPIYLYSDAGDRIGIARDGEEITVHSSDTYRPQFRITRKSDGLRCYVGEIYVSKPIPSDNQCGPSERLRLNSASLAVLGEESEFQIGGNHRFSSHIFRTEDELYRSIIGGLKTNWRVSDKIVNQIEEYATQKDKVNFVWNAEIGISERNELGKYLGELLPGSLILRGDWSAFDDQFIKYKPTEFGVPSDISFSGIDSYLSDGRSNTTFISSKFGPGAKASVFSNILPEAVRNYDDLASSELSILVDAAQAAGITSEILESKRGSKEVLYTYGMNEILHNHVSSPMSIFQNIREHVVEGKDLSSESHDVLNDVAALAEDCVREKLPGSITQFFSREAARRLNEDKTALGDMKDILSMKNFVQLNMNMPKWRAGHIEFRAKRSADSDIKVMGNKAAIGDIDARHGTLSYEIR